MIKLIDRFLIALFLVFISITSVSAQEKETLEKKRQKILAEIKFTEKLLSQTKTSIKNSFSDLFTIRKQITLRESLIGNTRAELKALQTQISDNKEIVKSLEADMVKLKSDYATVIRNSYKSQRLKDKLALVLSSKNFNEALRRLNYLRKYGAYRNKQAIHIEATRTSIERKIEEIERQRREKEILLNDQVVQKQVLDKEKRIKDLMVAELKTKEKTLSDDIRKKQKQAKKINKQIEEIIRRELEEARKKKSNANSTVAYKETPEYKNLSNSFNANKGKLPWPVEKGFVSKRFGQYNHPDLKNVKFENNGIDIRTEKSAPVRAVFKGKVISVFHNPVYKNAIIINHGEFFSVYTMLKSVLVKPNDEIDTKQLIGVAYDNTETGNTEVHLEIWKGAVKLNPAEWIYSK